MLDALSWALTAAAVLLVIYALRVTVQSRDPEKPGQKAGLGCGFFFLACLLWSLASHRWVGGWGNAFRLGMGIFLATPAIGALTKPHGARLFLGVIGLMAGIVLAGPVARDLVVGYQEREEAAPRLELEGRIGELRDAEGKLVEALDRWNGERLELTATLQSSGFADFSALQQDRASLARLERLDEIGRLTDEASARLDQVRETLRASEAELQRLTQAGEDAAASGLKLPETTGSSTPTSSDLSPVEEYARQKRLEALFEDLEQD